MSNLKCPFCQQELKPQTMDGEWLECWNCSYHEPLYHPFPQRILCGTKELWERLIYFVNEVDLAVEAQIERTKELERTRKALDVAVDALNRIDKQLMTGIEMTSQARNALEQITALKQKE